MNSATATVPGERGGARDLSIIIPAYNRFDMTQGCLRSLREHAATDLDWLDYEIIVVDNASSDATTTELEPLGRALFGKRFAVIRHAENLNFSGACNSGAEQAAGRRLFFLNNDTLCLPGWLYPLWSALEGEPDLGAVGPLLLYPDRRVQHLGIAFQVGGVTHLYAHFPCEHKVVRRRDNLQAITGAALLLDRALFMACGAFFTGYRNGFEDLELCLRIREQGKKLAVITQGAMVHLESQTPGRSDLEPENAELFSRRASSGFKVDSHLLAQEDGYALRLSPTLGTLLELPEQEQAALAPLLSDLEDAPAVLESKAYRKLAAEPFWSQAYAPVCASLEKSGDFHEALRLCFLRSRFYLSLEALQTWARIATRGKVPWQAAYAAEHIKAYKAKQSNPRRLIALARSQSARAEALGDFTLAAALQKWLAAQYTR